MSGKPSATRAQHLADDRLVDLQKASAATAKALEETKQAKKQTEAALAEAKEERSEAEAVTSFIVNAFRSPDPEQDARELKVIDLLSQAATELEKDFDGSARTKGKLLLSLGKTYIRLGLPELAVPILEKVRAEFEAAIGPEHDDTVSCINDLALSYRLMGRLDEALPLAEMVLRLTKAKYGADHLETALCVSNLADAYRDAGRLPEAITLGEEAFRV